MHSFYRDFSSCDYGKNINEELFLAVTKEKNV